MLKALFLLAYVPAALAADATTLHDISVTSSNVDAQEILSQSRANHDYVVGLRREIHKNPELMWTERATADVITRELDAHGIEYDRITSTGIVARVGRGERSVGLRADMDALPLREDTGLAYASRNDGKMHACGHDGHVAMLLGAAKVLKARYDADETSVPGVIRFIFQPAEEGGAGAKEMLRAERRDEGNVEFKTADRKCVWTA